MSRKTRNTMLIIGVLLLGIVLGVAVFFVHMASHSGAAANEEETPVPTVSAAPTPEPTPSPTPTPTPTPAPTPYVSPIDFNSLWAVNPHVIAWLDIPGTAIQYPILEHPTEENYYLNITIDGNYGYPGSIYINAIEGKDFDTFNTVIYGHNMANGTMFADLTKYQDAEFMNTHREVHIYTPEKEHIYTVCALVIYDDRYITYTYNDDVEADREAFLRSVQDGTWMDDVEVTTDSHIITLSTCIGGMPDNRRLLIAVETGTEPPASDMPLNPA